MMVAQQMPSPSQLGSLYGLNGQVHWPTFMARAGIRALILWPVVNFIGGVGGMRGVVTAVAGGSLYTGVELAWDSSALLAQSMTQQAQVDGLGDGLSDGFSNGYMGQRVVDTYSPQG